MLGGITWSVKAALDGGAPTPEPGPTDVLLLVAPLLMLAGVAGLHERYGERMAGTGRMGFAQSFIGLTLLALGFLTELFGVEGAERIASFGFLILAFGLLLIGFVTLRDEALPRWNFLPLALGLLIPLATVAGEFHWLRIVFSILFGIGWVLLGYLLVSETRQRRSGPRVPD